MEGGRSKRSRFVFLLITSAAKFTALLCSNTLLPAGETALYGSATYLRTIGVLLGKVCSSGGL